MSRHDDFPLLNLADAHRDCDQALADMVRDVEDPA